MARPFTIVTAADSRFARTLCQLLASAERTGLHRTDRFVAFDLGLTASDRSTVARRFPWCRVIAFAFDAYPRHVRDLRTFAWKPAAVCEAAAHRRGVVLWFDSATLFHGPLDPMLDCVERTGVFSLAGQTPLARCSDPRTLARLGAAEADGRVPYRAGGVLGFDADHPVVWDLLTRWRDHALDPDCIAPAGHDRRVHRFDQSILTALLCRAAREQGVPLGSDEIDISSIDPVRWVSTRNKVAPWMPAALDPVVRAYFAIWKRADRFVLRSKRVAIGARGR